MAPIQTEIQDWDGGLRDSAAKKKNLCIQLERILIAAELIRSAAGRGKHEEGGKRGLNGSNFKSQPVQ